MVERSGRPVPMTRNQRRVFIVVMVAALLHGLLYVVVIPSWDLFDESAHLDYALHLRDQQSIPRMDDEARDGLVATVAVASWPGWRPTLDPSTPPAEAGLIGLSYEGYQPPLYYTVVAVTTTPAGSNLRHALYAGRLLGPVLLVLLSAVAWGIARTWFPGGGSAVWASAGLVAVFVPAAAEAAGRVNNDLMVAVLVGASLLAAMRLVDLATLVRAALLGALGAAAVLTKSPGVLVLGIIAVALALVWRRHGLRPGVTLPALLPPVAALVGYSAFIHSRYQRLLGTDAFLDLAVPFVPLDRVTVISNTWLNAWSSYWTHHDGGTIRLAAGVVAVALLVGGIAATLGPRHLRPALVMTGVVVVGLLIMVWLGNRSGLVHPQGRLLLPALPPLAALVAGGWARWFGAPGALGAAALCMGMSAVYFLAWFRPLFLV